MEYFNLDTNQFILTYGKDPFKLKGEMEEFSSLIKEPVFDIIKNFLVEMNHGV